MDSADQIIRAKKLFGISYKSSIKQIRSRYKELLNEWHPDHCSESPELCHQKTQEIIEAFKILMTYAEEIPLPMSEEDIGSYMSVDEFWLKRFGRDPVWSPPPDEK